MKLVFDDLALADLEGIYNRIAKDNPQNPYPGFRCAHPGYACYREKRR